jgi:ATPase involved in DNA replication initiation
MSQLIFKFPFKTKYYKHDFYVSSNNFSAYKLIESWPDWHSKWVNVYGSPGSGKTHLSKILEKKIKNVKIYSAKEINDTVISILENFEGIIIDDFENNIDQKIFYSLLNQSKQLEKYILINSLKPLKDFNFKMKDLKSRVTSFLSIGIDLPTDDLLKVVIIKSFSDKQVNLDPKLCEYIIKNVERSYEKMIKFLKDVDELSLSSGKSININLIKKVLNK